MKKVFIVILNWNGAEMTVRCLESVAGCLVMGDSEKKTTNTQPLTPNTQIVVVDNGSTDGSAEMLEEWGKSIKGTTSTTGITRMKLIKNKENFGFTEGNNVGIRYALKNGADYVCLLNNDTRVAPDFLVQLIKVADSNNKIGIVGGKIYFEKGYEFHKERYKESELGKVIWYAGGIIDWQNVYAGHRGVDEVDLGQYDLPTTPSEPGSGVGTETEYVNGCLMLVKREVFEKVGLFDSKFFMYLEDTDFCLRAKRAEFKLRYAPRSVIWHLNAGSSGPGSNLHDYFLTRNRLLFGMRWAPLRTKTALIKESIQMLLKGREWQKIGVRDFYLGKFGRGSWHE